MQKYLSTVEKAKSFINENIEVATPDNVAAYCGYSSRHLSRIIEMVTGATLGELLRWTRLSNALYDLKYTDMSILDIALKYKYESQEAFTRGFKDTFGFAPGDYRKSDANVDIKGNFHLQGIVEGVSHEASYKGQYKKHDVSVLHVVKPARTWISFETNKENRPPHDFWNHCDMVLKSVFDRIIPSEFIIGYGAAYLTMIETDEVMRRMSWGLEIDGCYDIASLDASSCGAFRIVDGGCDIESLGSKGYDIFEIPESKYVVFNIGNHAVENHGSAIKSAWDAAYGYKYADYGLEWNTHFAPIYEDSSDELGYSVWFPVRDSLTIKAKKKWRFG